MNHSHRSRSSSCTSNYSDQGNQHENTIYVGNIQSIPDNELIRYFSQFGKIIECYHNCNDETNLWRIDYRFLKFDHNSNINLQKLLTARDHVIARIVLDVKLYKDVMNNDNDSEPPRLSLDKKICIKGFNRSIARNEIMKSFKRYGRILNCTIVENPQDDKNNYCYLEFDNINPIRTILKKYNHQIKGVQLDVQTAIRPDEIYNYNSHHHRNENRPTFNIHTSRTVSFRQNSPRQSRINSTSISCTSSISSPSQILPSIGLVSVNSTKNMQTYERLRAIENDYNQQLIDLEQEYQIEFLNDFQQFDFEVDKIIENQRRKYEYLARVLRDQQLDFDERKSEEGELDDYQDDLDVDTNLELIVNVPRKRKH
ncbi:unnamed protein product [Didymodactylos carnosus]|uniref:RRM domain-containing protein n=1 Tax=Didymodactylos carnosus TaxID=1234261 RepID=A0A815WXF4_9BILA|nr:unnamed protein product [Didymodactylos carnosus]CAF1547457.1 unnamed protein product [Didymodactylos carnosus]CAF4234748.1 unnamed protein product [Didymodactylos carnosus]CAF4408281.1 unnamed protein product [Didymodactylos carnosus]